MQNLKPLVADLLSHLSSVTTMVKGMHIEQAEQIKNSEIARELELPPVKIHCSVLAEDAIKAAIADFRKKQDEQ